MRQSHIISDNIITLSSRLFAFFEETRDRSQSNKAKVYLRAKTGGSQKGRVGRVGGGGKGWAELYYG